jgi:hypothetical protein
MVFSEDKDLGRDVVPLSTLAKCCPGPETRTLEEIAEHLWRSQEGTPYHDSDIARIVEVLRQVEDRGAELAAKAYLNFHLLVTGPDGASLDLDATIAKARNEEREACAVLCDELYAKEWDYDPALATGARDCAATIRAIEGDAS